MIDVVYLIEDEDRAGVTSLAQCDPDYKIDIGYRVLMPEPYVKLSDVKKMIAPYLSLALNSFEDEGISQVIDEMIKSYNKKER
jgi:hypothetical protein